METYMNKQTTKEGVVLIWEDGAPIAMIRGNGKVEYFELTPMGMIDHERLWSADNVQIEVLNPNWSSGTTSVPVISDSEDK